MKTSSVESLDLPENKGSKTNKLLVIVTILLFGFCGYLIWQNLELQKLLEDLINYFPDKKNDLSMESVLEEFGFELE